MNAESPADLIARVALAVGHWRERMVFTGGAATNLLVTDQAAAPPRVTDDVDVIVNVESWLDYASGLEPDLRCASTCGVSWELY